MHGLGNDFIVLDSLKKKLPKLTSKIAIRICDRRFGIGADQILHLTKPKNKSADARMEILNADGSIAEMCGNGIRAAALYLRDHHKNKKNFKIETLAGIKEIDLQGDLVNVDMGVPKLGKSGGEKLKLPNGKVFHFIEVNVGNPHAVIFVEDAWATPVEILGPIIERHKRFPKKTNVEFVQIENQNKIIVRVWERGAGITLACGTGACASAVASLHAQKASNPLIVQLPGGPLEISWAGPGKSVLMKGPATTVFQGEVEL